MILLEKAQFAILIAESGAGIAFFIELQSFSVSGIFHRGINPAARSAIFNFGTSNHAI